MTGAPGPLHGVRVVDISSSYAAPTTSMYLGDMGAEVIKIEPVRGDDARGWGPPFLNGEAAWFLSVNRNKKSLCLDIRPAAGRDVLFELLKSADVFIENLNPAKLEKHGLGLESLAQRFPHLVICACRASGSPGPDTGVAGLRPHRAGPVGNDERDGRRRRAAAGQHRAVGRRRGHCRRVRDRVRAGETADHRGRRDRRRRAPRGRPGLHGASYRELPRGRPGAASVRRHRLGRRGLPTLSDQRPPDRGGGGQRPAVATRLCGARARHVGRRSRPGDQRGPPRGPRRG